MKNNSKSTDRIVTITGQGNDGITGLSRTQSPADAGASHADGDGQENEELAWAKRHIREPVERKTELAGCGLPHRKKKNRPPVEDREEAIDLPPEELENHGDLIFLLFDRMDRTAARQDRKIERISRRVAGLEERGGFR